MTRFLLVCLMALPPAVVEAQIEAEDPSDYVRVLESGDPSLWDEAVRGLLGEEDELPLRSVASVIRRSNDLDGVLKVRLARALRHSARHPLVLETLLRFSREPDQTLRDAAFESLFTLRSAEAMEVFRELVSEGGPHRLEALRALTESHKERVGNLNDLYYATLPNPEQGEMPEEIFDQHYLPVAQTLLASPILEVRREALDIMASVITSGVNDALADLMDDPDAEIRDTARWELAERGDPRPCPALFEEAERIARTETDAYVRDRRLRDVGSACAPSFFLDYLRWYLEAGDESRRGLYREMIEGATDLDLLDHPEMLEELAEHVGSPDTFINETASKILTWDREARTAHRAETIRSGIRPLVLAGLALLAAILGALLFTWAWRLYALAVRVRHRPVSTVGSMAMGPVALEGEVQPMGEYLQHPATGEPCVYYAGADEDHPHARFYLVDDTGRVVIDPRRAVLFSDDGILVAGERVHIVGFADRKKTRSGGSTVVVGKDPAAPPVYRKMIHKVIEALFGFGRRSGVTKMLFSDPGRCFWIWDDLERRPMGEARDVAWLASSVLLGGAWIIVFAVAVVGLIDQDMSETLARALEALSAEGGSFLQ
jgi:hypothetical protein